VVTGKRGSTGPSALAGRKRLLLPGNNLMHPNDSKARRKHFTENKGQREEIYMAKQKQNKSNILVIWGDDIGISNLSCYSDGLMGYRTPNIDRLAKEG
jgi:hypothetical protein